MSIGTGGFFAVDRRAWASACKLGLNAAVAYLVLARGTGGDQRTTAWSVRAVREHTGIGLQRAQKAIAALEKDGLVHAIRKGTKPRYYLKPAHEIPGCEGSPPGDMDIQERDVFDRIAAGCNRVPIRGTEGEWGCSTPRAVALDLVKKGRARPIGEHQFEIIHYDPETAARPDWIWLPNALIDGADGNVAAPVELVRQTHDPAALRLLIDLYHAQRADEGGIHWRSIRQEFTRHAVGQRGAFTVYGFQQGYIRGLRLEPFVQAHLTGEDKDLGEGKRGDPGWKVFWTAWNGLCRLGLIELIGHLIEADTDEAEVVYPYAIGCGEPSEQRVAEAAQRAAEAILTPPQRRWAESKALRLAPVPAHYGGVQMVGIARLRYRARTTAASAWLSQMPKWDDLADRLAGGLNEMAFAFAR